MNVLDARRRILGKGVYKKTVEGNPAIAQGSLARRYPGIAMQGWTEQKSYEGKNLFNLDDLLSLIPESGSDMVNVALAIKGLTPNTDYTLSATIEGDTGGDYTNRCLYIGSTNANDSVFVGHPVSKSSGDSGEILVYFYPFRDIAQDIKSGNGNVQFEEGTVPTAYEPYTGRQPSPSPDYPQDVKNAGNYNEKTQKYEYGVKLTGKNLWDTTKAADMNNWVDSPVQSGYSDFAIDVAPGKKITASFPEKPQLGIGPYAGFVLTQNGSITNWIYHSGSELLSPQKVTFTSVGNKIWLRCARSTISGFLESFPYFQVEYGEERTDFQPYKEQTVTLTSDRPLTKWDKLEKRNGQWGWVYKSAEIVLDGSEDETWLVYNIGFKVANILPEVMLQRECYCTQFTRGTGYDKNSVWVGSNGGNSDIYFPNVPSYYDTELADKGLGNFKQHVSENPITILTYLDEETFVPLSESEQEQMNELYTFRPTTVLSNDCDCSMALTYKTKKSLQPVSGGGYKEA